MKIFRKTLPALLLIALHLTFPLLAAAASTLDKADIDKKLGAIVTYDRAMDRQPLIAVEKLIRKSQSKPEQRKYIEQRLASLLADATLEGKSFICKQLCFIGTAYSVPAIAKLLASEETADMACYAMGQNPSPEAGEALRDMLGKTPPKVQIRIINLLGERRDTESVEAIGGLVFYADKQVGEAAVTALGKIGGAGATRVLAQARVKGDADLKFAASDAYLRCAEDLAFEGEDEQAFAIYKELTGQDEVAIFRSAAIKGLADTGGSGAVPLVIAALRDQNRMVRITAAGCVRTMEGDSVTRLFAAELTAMAPAQQVLLIGALADRRDAAALPVIIVAAGSKDPAIRNAALQAVGKLGNATSVEFLVDVASGDNSSEDKAAAVNSLTLLKGDGVDDAITRSMQNSQVAARPQLIQVLSDRIAVGAIAALLTETANPESKVHRAAFKALARLAGEKDLPSLVEILVKIQNESGRRDAERAVIAVSRRITDEDKQADVVLTALSIQKSVSVKCSLLRVLGGIANSKSLDTVAVASQRTDAAVRDTAVRTLAKWPNASAAEVLLVIYSETQNPVHRLLALRGFARLLALPARDRPTEKTLDMCTRAMSETRTPDERKLVLSGLANVGDPKALTMVEPFLKDEAVRAEAATATIRIARKIAQTHPDKATAAMNKLLAVLENPAQREQAEEVIRRIDGIEKRPPQDG